MRHKFEIRSFSLALQTYLEGKGWSGLEYREGFQHEDQVIQGVVAIHFLPSKNREMQMGIPDERFIDRIIQVDAYMETEDRANAIVDDLMDFLEQAAITIRDNTNRVLGEMYCLNTQTILGEMLPPNFYDTRLKWWRGVARATFNSHYYSAQE